MLNIDQYKQYYSNLLIIQYKNKPKAKAHIDAMSTLMYDIYKMVIDMGAYLNIDSQQGVQLDVIGIIVGVSRDLPNAVPPQLFGFSDLFLGDVNPNAEPMKDLFQSSFGGFKDLFINQNTTLELDDEQYKQFIKAKISVNVVKTILVSDAIDIVSLNDAILQAFDGLAYLVDNSDMSMSLNVSSKIDDAYIQALWTIGLVAKPQGVRYNIIKQDINSVFGFSDLFTGQTKPVIIPFDDLFNQVSGSFADLLII